MKASLIATKDKVQLAGARSVHLNLTHCSDTKY
jgi:hypothetical protein